jgi:hypothetical protein
MSPRAPSHWPRWQPSFLSEYKIKHHHTRTKPSMQIIIQLNDASMYQKGMGIMYAIEWVKENNIYNKEFEIKN